MPYKTFLWIASHNTTYNHVGTLELLVSTDDFILSVLLISCKHSEELEDIHNPVSYTHLLQFLDGNSITH